VVTAPHLLALRHRVPPRSPGIRRSLASAARDAGADLRLGCAARFAAQPRGGYIVQLSTGERIRTNAAILATGRAGSGLGLPYARQYLDNHIAVAARFSLPAGHLDARTVIEAVPGGWFYLAVLPDNEVIAGFVTLATGPINVIADASQTLAKLAFSDRNP